MQKIVVKPSSLSGKIVIPPSKSQTLRAILFASLARGTSTLFNPLESPDVDAMISGCSLLGAKITRFSDQMVIEGIAGQVNGAEDVIDAGNSGIVFRFLTAVSALSPLPIVITGDNSIRHQRPIAPLLHALSCLGVKTISTKGDGFAPVVIQGPIKEGKTVIEAGDSQFVSALLIASLFVVGSVEITALNSGEKPWVDLTLDWFKRLHLPYKKEGYERYWIEGPIKISPFTYTVPSDFSSALFPIIAALITHSELVLEGLDFSDAQGDKKVIEWLQKMGGKIVVEKGRVRVLKGGQLKGLSLNINDCIDAITPLAVVACFAEGETTLNGAQGARFKECDRINATVHELSKMGAQITETPEGLMIRRSYLKGSTNLFSHGDHRMGMSLACAALGAEEDSMIEGSDCIAKTFPAFIKTFKEVGAQMEEMA